MKLKNLTALIALGCALFALCPRPASAANATVSYAADNLFLGFRQTSGQGATQDYLVNLGPVLNFDFTHNFTLFSTGSTGYGSVGTDLSSIFGASWYTAIDSNTQQTAVLFSLEAATAASAVSSDPKNTLYTTVPAGASLDTPYERASSGTQAGPSGNIQNMGNNGYAGNTSTANSDEGLQQTVASGATYGSYQPGGSNAGGISFNYFNPPNEAQTTNSIDFERIPFGAGATIGTPGTDLGTFSLDSSGDLTFTALSVPEPSTWACTVSGLGILLALRRRRQSK